MDLTRLSANEHLRDHGEKCIVGSVKIYFSMIVGIQSCGDFSGVPFV